MEEILSSIRRIIADEQTGGPPDAAPAPSPAPPSASLRPAAPTVELDDDVLELTEIAEDEAGVPPLAPAPTPPTETRSVTDKDEGLVSPTAASASTSAFAKLTRTMAPDERPASGLAGRTVEDLLLELLRPALKDWLDQNLPSVVERVVEQEVKKLARRAELS
jgi:cell pole-organizing protein PopZ